MFDWKVTQEACMKVLNYTIKRLEAEQRGEFPPTVAYTMRKIIELSFQITDDLEKP